MISWWYYEYDVAWVCVAHVVLVALQCSIEFTTEDPYPPASRGRGADPAISSSTTLDWRGQVLIRRYRDLGCIHWTIHPWQPLSSEISITKYQRWENIELHEKLSLLIFTFILLSPFLNESLIVFEIPKVFLLLISFSCILCLHCWLLTRMSPISADIYQFEISQLFTKTASLKRDKMSF